MDEPSVADLPSYHVVRLRYEGQRPPSEAYFDHWRRLNAWAVAEAVESSVDGVLAIGYEPPGVLHGNYVLYACIPVTEDFKPSGLEGLELAWLPGGRYILTAGLLAELPLLHRESRRYAASHGLAVERGGIELYRPRSPDSNVQAVDAGVRIHT